MQLLLMWGGGTGKYSEWLAKNGASCAFNRTCRKNTSNWHKKRAQQLKNPFSVTLGESRKSPTQKTSLLILVILHGTLVPPSEKRRSIANHSGGKKSVEKKEALF